MVQITGHEITITDGFELAAGLLGAKLDYAQAAFDYTGKYVVEARLLEIERRILAIESKLEADQ